MPQGGGVLPPGFTQLNSIWSTGAQRYNYIKTDFYALSTFVISGALSYFGNIGGGMDGTWICGAEATGTSRQAGCALFRNNTQQKLALDVMYGGYQSNSYYVDDNPLDTSRILEFETSRTVTTLAGESYTHSYGTGSSNRYFVLFRASADNDARTIKHKLYWLDIHDLNSGDLLHSFKPAMRDSDSKLGVYDIVGDKFYACTGTFQYD